jgi:hypothetical protein
MNRADEGLRAAARTAARMFPEGGDLPPLRLAERVGDRRAHASHADRAPIHRPRRVRAWLTPLAAASAVVAVVSALAVPHLIAGNAGPGKPARHVRAVPSSASRHEQRQFDALIVEWVAPATGPQYDLGGKVVWMLHVQELRSAARCMAMQGYHISDNSSPYNIADFADNSQMPDLPRIASTHQFVSQAGLGSAQSYPAAEQRALNACQRTAQAASTPLLNAYQPINQAWWKIISRAKGSRKVNAAIPALQACATRYGFPGDPYGNATGPIKSFGDFMDWVAGFLDGAGSRGASNHTMRSLARHWTSVFVTCATPIVGIWQRMLRGAQPGFLHQHAQQIAKLDKLALRELAQRHD